MSKSIQGWSDIDRADIRADEFVNYLDIARSHQQMMKFKLRTFDLLSASFRQGNAFDLDLPSNRFDGTRADRVFQRLSDPARALAEMVRVTRPGGRVVVGDPDYGGFFADTSYPELLKRLQQLVEMALANPWSGRRLPALFQEAGLTHITVDVEVLAISLEFLTASTNTLSLYTAALQTGLFTEDDLEGLQSDLADRAAAGRWFAGAPFVIVSGPKP